MTLALANRLEGRKSEGNLRQLRIFQNLIDFASNDYLGLATGPSSALLAEALREEWEGHAQKLGSTGSRLLTGNSVYVENLEKKIAAFHGYEEGLLFNCGYMANLGLLSTVARENDAIFFDAAVHASTHDGIRLSRAQSFPFRHNNLEHLENRLKHSSASGSLFICIESLYSIDGSQAPLSEIALLAKKYEAHLIIDEAHAVGVCGPQGRGLVAKHNLTADVFAQVTTFGKAPGVHGSIVLGNNTLKQALINFATPCIYTTALPFYSLAAIKASYDLFPQLESEREKLHRLITLFPQTSGSQIQSLVVKGNESVKQKARELIERGFDVRPLTSPTVQKGHEALRICLHAFNTEDEVNQLLRIL